MEKVAKIFIDEINYIDGYTYIFFIKDLKVPNLARGPGEI